MDSQALTFNENMKRTAFIDDKAQILYNVIYLPKPSRFGFLDDHDFLTESH